MRKELLDHIFPNGNRLHVTETGFTLWDAYVGRWVLDASCLVDQHTFEVSSDIMRNKSPRQNPEYNSFYPEAKMAKVRKSKTKKKGRRK